MPDERRLIGVEELNVLEYPLGLLGDRPPKGVKTLYFQDTYFDHVIGQEIRRSLTIAGSDLYGLPTSVDEDVYVALLYLTKLKNGLTEPLVYFSRYELINLLRWRHEGKYYERLTTSFLRWKTISLVYEMAWRVDRRPSTKALSLLRAFSLSERVDPLRLDSPRISWFLWEDIIFNSLKSGHLKPLNLDVYFAIKSPIARRAFRYCDKQFFKRDSVTFDLDSFAYQRIGLSRMKDVAQVKRRLAPALKELEEIGFLAPTGEKERYQNAGKREWKIVLVKGRPQAPPPPPLNPIERALIDHGVRPDDAREMVSRHPAELVQKHLDLFQWRIDDYGARKEKVISPVGLLVKSIREDWPPPKNYVSHLAAVSRKVEVEDKIQKQSDERSRRVALERDVWDHWGRLDEAERQALDGQAMKRLDPDTLDGLKKLPPASQTRIMTPVRFDYIKEEIFGIRD